MAHVAAAAAAAAGSAELIIHGPSLRIIPAKKGNVDLKADDQNACERLRLVGVVVESKWVSAACSIRSIAGACIEVAEDEVRCNCNKGPEEINEVAPA